MVGSSWVISLRQVDHFKWLRPMCKILARIDTLMFLSILHCNIIYKWNNRKDCVGYIYIHFYYSNFCNITISQLNTEISLQIRTLWLWAICIYVGLLGRLVSGNLISVLHRGFFGGSVIQILLALAVWCFFLFTLYQVQSCNWSWIK